MGSTLRRILRRIAAPALGWLDHRTAHHVRLQVESLERDSIAPLRDSIAPLRDSIAQVRGDIDSLPPTPRRVFVPPIEQHQTSTSNPFMQYSSCSAADFFHPRFVELCSQSAQTPHLHRKLWEHIFILHHLTTLGMLTPDNRGVGFGVGSEPLPAVFAAAGATVVATDAPIETAQQDGWQATNQFASSVASLEYPEICDVDRFHELVSYRTADMNALPEDLTNFDFCWSACCFEHLGSLRHGTDFVIESVERCLRPGGIAVHTTEFNLSSNTDTLEAPQLSIYRHSDLAALVVELERRGHTVAPVTIAPDAHVLDHFVDLPPYHGDLHLKLELDGYATTSVGLVITKAG